MKRVALVFLLVLSGCNRQAKVDSTKLETLLSDGHTDRIELITYRRQTNILTGTAAQQYAFFFRATNRIAKTDWTKAQVSGGVALISGTSKLGWIDQFDNGLWKFGDYSFRLRVSP